MLIKFLRTVRILLEMVKFEHTIFALPFALISVVLAAQQLPDGWPAARVIGWVLAAMVGARSAAMAFNRIVDSDYDAINPRTARRALPSGLLTLGQVIAFTIVAVGLFEWAAWELNPLCFVLSPLALAAMLGYSFTKRFTYLSHLCLGLAIGLSPIGAWLAVTGQLKIVPVLLGAAVMLWIGGFDIIYALQDYNFDLKTGLHSLPKAIGPSRALLVSRIMHASMLLLMVTVGWLDGLHWAYYFGVLFVGSLIAYEQSLVKPEDISRVDLAFFTLNGWVSVSMFIFVLLDRLHF